MRTKSAPPYVFIAVSSIALLTVLLIQVSWIFEAAKTKEELFNEKASMVLSKTADALAADTATYRHMESRMGKSDSRKIDSLLKHYMSMYNVRIAYFFEVKPGSDVSSQANFNSTFAGMKQGCYQACVKESDNSSGPGLELKLVFPDKDEFIMAEMGIPFISSVVLILVVLVLSWRTILSLQREKKISEHTTDFLNNMTHEFKTPLTNIALAGKMMVKEPNIRQEDKVKQYAGIILEENDKLRLQVEQVLGMTALERGEIPLHTTELDVHPLIRDCLKCMSLQMENRQGHVTLNLTAEKSGIIADKTHLSSALCNLIDNAIKYSRERPELSIQTSNSGQSLCIVVSDNGMGIDPKYQNKVFDTFFRVPTGNIHDVKGFGLGLAYVKKIIELHGGSIALQSEKGVGTTFTITLPYA